MKTLERKIEGYLLSPQQERLWKILSESGQEAFRIQARIGINGPLNLNILKEALHDTVSRHEILRTNFRFAPGIEKPLQVVGKETQFILIEHEKSSAKELSAKLEELSASERQHSINLEDEPLLRVHILHSAHNEHTLLLSMPSLCADAGTVKILIEEIGKAYHSRSGAPVSYEEPLQYAQFSELQNEILSGEENGAGVYWTQKMSCPPPVLKLPFEKREISSHLFKLKSITLDTSAETLREVESIADNHQSSVSAVLLTAWKILLWRLSGQTDVWVSVATDGRKFEELDTMPGLCARYLPIGLKLEDGQKFYELLRMVESAANDAYEWQEEFAFEPGEDGKAQFLPFAFEYNRLPDAISYGPLRFEIQRIWSCIDRWNLRLSCEHGEGVLRLSLDFNPEVLNEEHVRKMFDRLQTLVHSASLNGEATIDSLEIIGDEEKNYFISTLNDTDSNNPILSEPVHILFERQSKETPDEIAIEAGRQQITFHELNARANKTARYLNRLGIGPDKLVGILMNHSVDMVVGILGTLKAGGAYVPLDPQHPAERLSFMLEDAGASLLLTEERLKTTVEGSRVRTICLDSEWDEIAKEDDANRKVKLDKQNLAYVIYTSGSTGSPKGAMITHGGLSNYLGWAIEAYGAAQGGAGAPLHSSIAFDMSVTSLFAPLLVGKRIMMARRTTGIDALAAAVREHENFSLLKITPAHSRLLGQQLSPSTASGRARVLILGGEALTQQDIKFWRENALGTTIVNEYGPTETVVGSCVYSVQDELPETETIPIGRPIANTQLYVLDKDMRPVPAGVTGELYIGGVGLARGYLNRPELTAEKFVPNPFIRTSAGERLYKTGDLARYLPDGNLEFLGRNDHQIKVRGYRVEPAEIETELCRHKDISEAFVMAAPDGSYEESGEGNNQRLIAYLVAKQNRSICIDDVRKFLERKLPHYMIPSAYVLLQSIPLTASGKVDRKALPTPDEAATQAGSDYTAPRTMEEEILAGIWSRVLNLSRVGIDDKYFSLGGDSIRSIQIVARAQERGLNITVDQVFKHQTIRELVKELKSIESNSAPSPKTEPFSLLTAEDHIKLLQEDTDVEDAYPLSKLQSGMIFHRELHPDTAVYHDVFGYQMKAPLNLELLKSAIDGLIQRHPILRTAFDMGRFSLPIQIVRRTAPTPLTVEDISPLSPEEQEATLSAFIEAEKKRGFDYGNPPLLRFHVHIRSKETFQFWISFHHAILDGWSDISLLVELLLSYNHLLKGERVPFNAPAVCYRDFIALELEALNSKEQEQFWQSELEDCSPMILPRWRSGTLEKSRTQDGALYQVSIPTEVSEGLQALARASAISIKSVLLAAHMRVMSFLRGEQDALTALVSVGRPETVDGDKVLGLHLNSLPFRMRLDDGTWFDLVKQTFEAERRILPYRRFPMAEIQRLIGVQRLSETLFYFTHYYNALDLQKFPDLEVIDWYEHEESSFTLSAHFAINPYTSQVGLNLTYDPAQLCIEQVEAIAGYFTRTLSEMASNPANSYKQLLLLSDDERRKLLVDWNSNEAEFETGLCVHQLFEAQAAKTPDALALKLNHQELTYEELNARANQLARHLRANGAGPETVVGLCMERSVDLVVGILGVLKSGAAYLPIDPSYPADRITYMLEDAGAALVLAHENLLEDGAPSKLKVIRMDKDWSSISVESTKNLPSLTYKENAAYVIYTSGSTGKPKGVIVPHSGPANHAQAIKTRYELDERDKVLQFAGVGFDVLAEELFPTLISGASVCLWPDQLVAAPGEILKFIDERQLTVINLPTPYWHEMVSELERSNSTLPLSLRHVIVGSDTASPQKLRAWMNLNQTRVGWTNCYGLTETTITSTIYELPRGANAEDYAPVPIGRPINNVKVYLLNRRLEPVPVGVAGEVYIGGVGTARGYVNHPDYTAERFIPDPFSRLPGAVMYKTGDAARYLPDGNLQFLGRLDDRIKIRGFRIEPLEIESLLERHPMVKDAVVTVGKRVGGDESLAAYVVPAQQSHSLTVSDLRSYLRSSLPDYMIPSAFVMLESLPLNANGKIDYKLLPDPRNERLETGTDYISPETPAQEVVAGVWMAVLNLDRVGIKDNFFELGGHSLLATQLVVRLRDIFQVELPLRKIYESPTVEGTVKAIEEMAGGKETVDEISRMVKELEHLSVDQVTELLSD